MPEPAVAARISVGGRFVTIDARQAIDIPTMTFSALSSGRFHHKDFLNQQFELPGDAGFPAEWTEAVRVTETAPFEETHYDTPIQESKWFLAFLRKLGWTA